MPEAVIVAATRSPIGRASRGRERSSEQVRSRVLPALAQEARLMLDDGVVADAKDIDLAMIIGAGWPTWLGGITPYLDREGISELATGKRFAPAGIATFPTTERI